MKGVFTKADILCIGSVLTQILNTKSREPLLDDAAIALTEVIQIYWYHNLTVIYAHQDRG